jgi:lysophospholipase L1-like esterase
MNKPNIKTTRLLLIFSVLVNLLLIGFLGFKYINSNNTPIPNYTMSDQANEGEIKFFLGRDEVFTALPNDSNEIIMLGNSLTHNFEWHEIFPDFNIKNRGINGDITLGVLQRLPEITASNPTKIFIEIGINDIQQGYDVNSIIKNYENILLAIKTQSPSTKVYVQNILPTNLNLYGSDKNIKEVIYEVNAKLETLCATYKITFIDLYSEFNDEGNLKPQYDCGDHLHLSGAGYLKWCELISNFIAE